MHIFKHLRTITKHRHKVFIHCVKAGIPFQGLLHDLSKYSLEEFLPSAKYYQGTRSPNEGERQAYGYSKAWLHHKGRNKHHFEYWRDVDPVTRLYHPIPMPLPYLVEMFCDRVAASKIYRGKEYTQNDPLSYYEHGHAKEMMHEETAKQLETWLRLLAEQGEKEAFSSIRQTLKEYRQQKRTKK